MSHPKEMVDGIHLMMDMNAENLFAGESNDWRYCVEHAPFQHRESCEFQLYCGGELAQFHNQLKKMAEFGCTQQFISAVKYARDKGALWLLLHAG